jgi:hypothetical protein
MKNGDFPSFFVLVYRAGYLLNPLEISPFVAKKGLGLVGLGAGTSARQLLQLLPERLDIRLTQSWWLFDDLFEVSCFKDVSFIFFLSP